MNIKLQYKLVLMLICSYLLCAVLVGCTSSAGPQPPASPVALTATREWNTDGSQTLKVSWLAPSTGSASSFKVYQRAEYSSEFSQASGGSVTTLSYERTITSTDELDADIWLRVSSVGSGGEGTPAECRATAPPPPPFTE